MQKYGRVRRLYLNSSGAKSGKILPPQRPHMALIRDFRIRDLYTPGVQVRLELPVHADELVGCTASDPTQFDLSVRLYVEFRKQGSNLAFRQRRAEAASTSRIGRRSKFYPVDKAPLKDPI